MAYILGTTASEVLTGSNGDDIIDHGGGSDVINGASGLDTLSFFDHSSHYRIRSLLGVTRVTGHRDADIKYADFEVLMTNVENIQFGNKLVMLETASSNVILGTVANEALEGSDDDDIIDHGGGADSINGGEGFDTVIFFDHSSNYRITKMYGVTRILGLGDEDTERAAAPYKAMEVILNNVESVLFTDKRVTAGGDGNDRLQTWFGKDTVEGGGGVDTVVFENAKSAYSVNRTSTGFTVNGATGDTNTLTNVERLEFADRTLAFDFQEDGLLYNTTLIATAAAGRSFIENPAYLGVGLDFAQPYADMQLLAEAVVDLGIYDGLSNQSFVQVLFQNVQHTPTAAETSLYLFALDFGIDRSQILRVFAESDYNLETVNLVGLQQTGIEFV